MSDASYIAAGFFVTKAVARDVERSPGLLPPALFSLSPCIASSYQVHWGWDVARHGAEAIAFGLPEARLPALVEWERGHGISHPNVFHSLEDARAFVAEFLPARADVLVVGAGLPAVRADGFLATARADLRGKQPWGVCMMVERRQPLPEGGEPLGLEMLSYDCHNLGCSWLCTGTERDVRSHLGIVPNAHGLVDALDDALRIDEWIAAHPDRVEPGPYHPWLLVRYAARLHEPPPVA